MGVLLNALPAVVKVSRSNPFSGRSPFILGHSIAPAVTLRDGGSGGKALPRPKYLLGAMGWVSYMDA